MKKIVKLFIISIFITLNISIVNAADCGGDDFCLYGFTPSYNIVFPGEVMQYKQSSNSDDIINYVVYSFSDKEGNLTSSYCRNPVFAPTNLTGTDARTTYVALSRLFDGTNDNEKLNAYEYGIIEILRKGYREEKYVPVNSEYKHISYAATGLALRTFEILSPYNSNKYGNFNAESIAKLNIHGYYANKWKSEYSDDIKYLYGELISDFGSHNEHPKWIYNYASNLDPTGEIETEAKRLLSLGFAAARKYKDSGAATLKGIDSKPQISYKDKETTLTYILDAEKFNSKDAYFKLKVNCNNCSQNNVGVSIMVNNQTSKDGTIKIDNPKGKYEIKIKFTKQSKDHCPDINYELEVEWFDESISAEAYNMQAENCKSCQQFYVLVGDGPIKETIKNKINLCGKVDNCKTYIENAACSDTDSNINLTEGYEIESDCTTKEENVLKCIINHSDPVGNSYQVSENVHGNFEKVLDNDFCSVFCKEDYHFTLPGIKEANSGRYFSLEASISGTKTCYTSKIDKDNTFTTKLEEKREDVIDAWNEWNRWYVGSLSKTKSETKSVRACCNGGTYSYINYYRDWIYTKYSYNGTLFSDDESVVNNGSGNCSCNLVPSTCGEGEEKYPCSVCGSGSCNPKNGDPKVIEETIKSNLLTAQTNLNSAIKAYTALINEYNACSGTNTIKYDLNLNYSNVDGWKMKYDYDPKINFWYEESYMNNVLTDELQIIGNASVGNFNQKLCKSDTNDSYESCNNNWFANLDKNDTKSQFVCKQNGTIYSCGHESIVVSKAKYVKQSMESSSKYITPTQFYNVYPTGAIVVAEAGKNIENSKELTNMLPVGLGTNQGVYNYTLKVSNLGEYYNKDSLGRIWGDSNSVVVNTLKDEYACVKDGALNESVTVDNKTQSDGVYVCAYKVNCPNCPVVCDPDCKRPDCPNNNCPVECENCVYTNNNINIGYRPITPGNINPNDREMGINWKWDDKNPISTALELKAYATTKEIEDAGETIYDIDYEDTTTNNEFAMQVKLDRQMINLIKNYNDQYENNDGYANNTLKCYDYKQDGKTYDNIYCYSTFIDKLIEETGGPGKNGGSDKIKIVGGERYFSEAEREAKTQISGYWTTWAEANTNSWTITTQKGIAYYQKNYKEIGIGPAWK